MSEGAVVVVIEAGEGAAAATPAKPAEPKPEPTPIAGDTSPQALAREEGKEPARAPTPPPPKRAPAPAPAIDTRPGVDPEAAGPRTPPVPFEREHGHAGPGALREPGRARDRAPSSVSDLRLVKGSERKGRITKSDVRSYVKSVLSGRASAPRTAAATGGGGLNLLPWPTIDFSKFGEIETKPLSKIKKISGANLARNWAMIPHVTQHDEADVTDLEALRVSLNKENEKAGIKLTMLAFLIKAVVLGAEEISRVHASLDASGENLTLKKYFNIGFAADTPNGLVVPVLRDADRKGVIAIATEPASSRRKRATASWARP